MAGALLYGAFERLASEHHQPPPLASELDAGSLLQSLASASPEHVLVAATGGAVVGVGAARLLGEVATIGPIAVAADGRGIGGAILDALIERADEAGAQATRAVVAGWNQRGFALFAARGFATVDVAASIERAPGEPLPLDNSRGLEVREVTAADFAELGELDRKLTGLDRGTELAARVQLVARRRGALVGYLARNGELLGPAVAVDVSDLFLLVAHALPQGGAEVRLRARLSTAAPTGPLAALALGFRIHELGLVVSRGAQPPARPPQLYSSAPLVL